MMGCTLCPRRCNVDRDVGKGFCGVGSSLKVARAALHHWEEPCISGTQGSGTVFFSGCVLKCIYCQNHQISAEGFGKEISISRLAEIFIELKAQGAHNINLVNPTHFVPQIKEALDMVRNELKIPVVYNTGGYERVETLKMMEGYVDIYLPDIKYFSDEAAALSKATDYFDTAMAAVEEMLRQTGAPVIEDGILKKGTVVRHLVLPG
ncbi:MAG: radical SAM protein, partial [Oscillospiraceae bacterium]|nr:radical SAM protein [Oscillospiraceae bacterium]